MSNGDPAFLMNYLLLSTKHNRQCFEFCMKVLYITTLHLCLAINNAIESGEPETKYYIMEY